MCDREKQWRPGSPHTPLPTNLTTREPGDEARRVITAGVMVYTHTVTQINALYTTHNNCSSSHTGEDDFFEIIELLQNEQARCYEIGTWLRLRQSLLKSIRAQTLLDYAEALNQIITNWLQRNYNTMKYGFPTWKMLAEAVKAPNGGNKATLADEIARLHPATG